jgi:hypothetical protein
MIVRNLLLTMWMAGTLAAQTFIQMSDPQFGMYTKNANFETVNFEFAIASANRLKPARTRPRDLTVGENHASKAKGVCNTLEDFTSDTVTTTSRYRMNSLDPQGSCN